jgi:hypothetical protein
MWESPTVSPITNYIDGRDHSQYILEQTKMGYAPHDFRVAPGAFDLESSTAFVEPARH